MNFKAIFFDRDGTLTFNNPEKEMWRNRIIEDWSGKPFEFSYEKMTQLFQRASNGNSPWYKSLNDEREFFMRYYKELLIGEAVEESLENRATLLFDELWCNNDKLLYPETIETLEYFKEKNYKMGVISNTSPSLEYTLQQLGIAKYFTSFTASSLVGAGKPNPIIFNAALNAQNAKAIESIYVDDGYNEVNGAREQGFTSFLVDRKNEHTGNWVIKSLTEIVDFVENL